MPRRASQPAPAAAAAALRARAAAAGALAALALLAWAAGRPAAAAPVGILTYNIYWGGQPHEPVLDRHEEWLEAIKARNPDIVLLQEANGWLPEEEDYIAAYVDSLNASFPDLPPFTGCVADARSAFNVALISRYPVLSFEAITTVDIGGQVVEINHAFARATLLVNGEALHCVAVHFAPGTNRAQRELEARALLAILDALPPGDTVWIGGDFNSYSPVDIAPGSATPPDYVQGADPAEVKGWEPIGYLLERGFEDAFRALHPFDDGYTQATLDFIPGTSPIQRVDALLHSPGSPWICIAAETAADSLGHIGSDHYAVYAEFQYDAAAVAPPSSGAGLTLRPVRHPGLGEARAILELEREQGVVFELWTIDGRRLRSYAGRTLPPGRHAFSWDGRDAEGRRVAAGSYLLRARGAEGSALLRCVLLGRATGVD